MATYGSPAWAGLTERTPTAEAGVLAEEVEDGEDREDR